MTKITQFLNLKKIMPAMVVFAVLITVFSVSSYDPYNELTILTPENAQAALVAGSVVDKSGSAPAAPDVNLVCNISVNGNSNATVNPGENAVISWQVEGYGQVTLTHPDGRVESVPNSGSVTANNIQTNLTYTIRAQYNDGNGFTATCNQSVRVFCVNPPPPPPLPECVSFTASDPTITPGQSGVVTIDWITRHAVSASINQGIGPVSVPSGTRIVNPTVTTTYVLTVTGANNQTVECSVTITVTTPSPAPICVSFTATPTSITPGQSVTLIWTTQNGNSAFISPGVGSVLLNGTRVVNPTVTTTYTLTVFGNPQNATCTVTIIVDSVPPPPLAPVCLSFTVDIASGAPGSQRTLSWTTQNATVASISAGVGSVSDRLPNGSITVNPTVNTTYTLLLSNASGQQVSCAVTVTVTPVSPLAPVCLSFTVDIASGAPGSERTLSWTTQNATSASINGIGAVAVPSGSRIVNPTVTTTYTLLVVGANGQTANCAVTVTVTPVSPLVPACLSFTVSPVSGAPGSTRTLTWTTQNATNVSISQGVGSVAINGSTVVNPSVTTTYTLFLVGANGQTANCAVTVTVVSPIQLTCPANVTFTASPTSVRRGNSSTLTWSTTGVTTVSFDNGITANGLSGSITVEPSNTTTYNLTASNGVNTVTCPVQVTVTTGGGGGGTPTPRCELSISKNRISLGQSVELRWNSSNATHLKLEDRTARKTLVDTDGLSARDRERLLKDTLTVSPRENTTYLLTVTRGSRERTCTVDVRLDDNVVVTQIRDQQPLVAGIALTQVPYTGFEAGPILTVMFYLLLLAWALYIAYILVIKRDTLGGLKLASVTRTNIEPTFHDEYVSPQVLMSQNATVEPAMSFMPANLPIAPAVVGYANLATEDGVADKSVRNIDEDEMTTLENYAHERKILISSDAIRHFVATTNSVAERTEALDQVIKAAKEKFPTEDGWVVLNEKRMQDLCVICSVNQAAVKPQATYIPAVVPTGAGSLAEAIVSGNVVAAYDMIGHRPMFALADAAADLDTVYRLRRGGKGSVSELLMKETASLSDEQILAVIAALTGALDGVYTDEAAAVKMSIMKAIKVVA